MTKKFVSMLLALAMCLSLSAPAFAAEGEADPDDGWICIETIVYPESERGIGIDEEGMIVPYADNFSSEITVLDSSWDYVYTDPSGQDNGGYRFDEPGGSVYVNTLGGVKVTVDLSAAWIIDGKFSVSVNVGIASKSNIGGICVNVPGDGNYYRVELRHEYLLERLRVAVFNNGVLVEVQENRTRVAVKRTYAHLVKM